MFLVNALFAGTFIALACGTLGYFLVLRNQVFASDALSHVAFTGSLAALAFGVEQSFGLFAATIAVGIGLALLSSLNALSDVTIGTTFSWLLGLGSLFLYLFTESHSGTNANAGPNILFGSVFGIDTTSAITAAIVSVVVLAIAATIARPLLYASIDAGVAAIQGVPTRLLGTLFLVVTAIQIAETVQLLGALLLLGLIATPAATATMLTSNPYRAMVLSSLLALAAVWLGIAIGYVFPDLPPTFCIVGLAFATYLAVALQTRHRPTRSIR